MPDNSSPTNVQVTHGEQALGDFIAACANMMLTQDRIFVVGIKEDGDHLDIDTRVYEMDSDYLKVILAKLFVSIKNDEGADLN